MTYEPQIEKGIALLDKKEPDWCRRIDLKVLDLRNPRCCVLGQVYAQDIEADDLIRGAPVLKIWHTGLGFWRGAKRLKLRGDGPGVTYGFNLRSSKDWNNPEWDVLTADWKKAIRAHCKPKGKRS